MATSDDGCGLVENARLTGKTLASGLLGLLVEPARVERDRNLFFDLNEKERQGKTIAACLAEFLERVPCKVRFGATKQTIEGVLRDNDRLDW